MKEAIVYKTSEAVLILRLKLGTGRCWEQALMEMRIRGGAIKGFQLLPCVKIHDNRSWRPYYDKDTIDEFIRNLLDSGFEATRGERPISKSIKYDPNKFWTVQKIKLRRITTFH